MEQQPPNQPPYQQQYQQPYQPQQNYNPYPGQLNAPVVPVGTWIVTFLLMLIPLVNLIMLIVWAASGTENPNRKNWAIATLLMYVIYIVLFMLMGTAIMGMLGGLAESLS